MIRCDRCGQNFGDASERWTLHAHSSDCIKYMRSVVEEQRKLLDSIRLERDMALADFAAVNQMRQQADAANEENLDTIAVLMRERDAAQREVVTLRAAIDMWRASHRMEQDRADMRTQERDERERVLRVLLAWSPRNVKAKILEAFPWLEETNDA